jgi:hypothetical protein
MTLSSCFLFLLLTESQGLVKPSRDGPAYSPLGHDKSTHRPQPGSGPSPGAENVCPMRSFVIGGPLLTYYSARHDHHSGPVTVFDRR